MCGAMARPARLANWTHTRFVPDLSGYSCRSCIKLVTIPNETVDSGWPPTQPSDGTVAQRAKTLSSITRSAAPATPSS